VPCGSEEDRDVIAVKNLLRRHQTDVGASTVHPENPPMKGGGKECKITLDQNGKVFSEQLFPESLHHPPLSNLQT
jgi:hypothetical protein